MSEAPKYTIRTIGDFLKVPEDRRELCLREFRVFLDLVQHSSAFLAGVGAPVKPVDAFVWIDDGLHTAKVSVQAGEQTIVLAAGRMKGFGK